VQFKRSFSQISTAAGCVTATFTDGSHAKGNLLIGADGTKSIVRQFLFGAEEAGLIPSHVVMSAVIRTLNKETAVKLTALRPIHSMGFIRRYCKIIPSKAVCSNFLGSFTLNPACFQLHLFAYYDLVESLYTSASSRPLDSQPSGVNLVPDPHLARRYKLHLGNNHIFQHQRRSFSRYVGAKKDLGTTV
jgi:2-polyprenyl-6-methoxyphenol hydroxylase-like FAD-dependent oxidoreductase